MLQLRTSKIASWGLHHQQVRSRHSSGFLCPPAAVLPSPQEAVQEERLLGCTQPLPLVAVLLSCHPSVSAADSLKHSTVPTTVSHRELAHLSEGDESSPAPTAATLRPPNSALKIAAHKATEAGSLLLHPVLTQWDDLHPTAVFTRKE